MYCFSEHLVPKPEDWGPNVDITGAFTVYSSREADTQKLATSIFSADNATPSLLCDEPCISA